MVIPPVSHAKPARRRAAPAWQHRDYSVTKPTTAHAKPTKVFCFFFSKKKNLFFFEKKNQKTLASLEARRKGAWA
jgi:hypothetical protein